MTKRPEPMTVGKLREVLAAFDQDAPVLVPGYEGGWDYPGTTQIVEVYQRNTEWYYGRFEEPYHRADAEGKDTFRAVAIPR